MEYSLSDFCSPLFMNLETGELSSDDMEISSWNRKVEVGYVQGYPTIMNKEDELHTDDNLMYAALKEVR